MWADVMEQDNVKSPGLRAMPWCAVKGHLDPVGGRYPTLQLTFQPEAVEAMGQAE
jgi:hypothetical protein